MKMTTFEARAYEIIRILKSTAARLSELDKKHAAAQASQLDKAA